MVDNVNVQDLVKTPKRPSSKNIGSSIIFASLNFDNAPDFLRQDNQFIHIGYRPQLSPATALYTIFRWHNETLNIWSHLVGLAIFIAFLIDTTTKWSFQHSWPLIIYEAGAITVFAASSLYHTMCCVSATYYKNYRRLDFIGIIIVMWSMFWPWVIYCFKFSQPITIAYLTIATVISIATATTALSDVFLQPKLNAIRPVLFAIQGIFGIVPLVHASSLYYAQIHTSTKLVVLQLSLHAIGATFYATKIPERYFPYTFDNIANSHTIFHVFIVAGLVSYFFAVYHLALKPPI